MDRGFNDDTLVEGAKERKKTKHSAIMQECGLAPADAARQLAWLRRDSAQVQSANWRPPALHRAPARRWVMAMDNQLRVGTEWPGLARFRFEEGGADWLHWADWPGLGLAMDLGADGVAGASALMYGFDCNVWAWPDPSHTCQRSFEAVLKETGLWSMWLLLLVSWNLEHGPFSDRHRHSQLREALSVFLDMRRPEQSPLFLELCPIIAKDLEEAGLATFDRQRGLEDEVWRYLQERARQGGLGRRVSMNRFGGTQHAALLHRPLWAVELFERTLLALELDFLSGSAFVQKVVMKEDGAEKSTDPRKPQIDEKGLRACCGNAVTISVMTLSDFAHRRATDIVLTLQKPLDSFHSHQNRTLRDVESTRSWLLDQVSGGLGRHLSEFVKMLCCPSSLTDAGFLLQPPEGRRRGVVEDDESELSMLTECENADLDGQMVFSFVSQRAFRMLYLEGWPHRMLAALNGDKEKEVLA